MDIATLHTVALTRRFLKKENVSHHQLTSLSCTLVCLACEYIHEVVGVSAKTFGTTIAGVKEPVVKCREIHTNDILIIIQIYANLYLIVARELVKNFQ